METLKVWSRLLEGENRLLGPEYFLNQILVVPRAISVVRGFLVQVLQLVSWLVRHIGIYRGVRLQDEERNFLLCGEECTTFLGGILLGLLVYRVSVVPWDGMHGSRILDEFQMGLTRIYGYLRVRP